MSTGKKFLPPSPRPPQGPSHHSPNAPRGPRVLQPKAAAPLRPKAAAQQARPTAPPVYRPQPTPKVLQRKSAAVTPPANAAQRTPAAPPVYRPQAPPRVLQTKAPGSAAPPVYRPQPLPRVLQRKSDQTPTAPLNAAQSGATRGRPGVVQPKATPAPPAAYRPQPAPLCLRSNKPAASSVAQRKILISGKDIDLPKHALLKTHLESQLQQYGIGKTNAIYTSLRANDTAFNYDSEDEVAAEIKVRQHIVSGIDLIHAHAGYNHGGDTLSLGDEWEILPGVAGKEAANKHIFKPTDSHSDAISQLFETEGNLLECSSATVAVHYHALLEVMGPKGFDEDLADQVVIMPEFVNIKKGKNDEEDAPSRTLIPEVEVSGTSELVPGDWVYFMNYPEYAEVNKLLEKAKKLPGPFEWENAVYLGGGRYRGFGVPEGTFDAMVNLLKKAYNDLLTERYYLLPSADKKKYPKKTGREDHDETLDGKVPGIEKTTVRRMMANPEVRANAGSRVYDMKRKEIRAQINIAPTAAALQQIWTGLNAEFRDAVKDTWVNRLRRCSTTRPRP